MNEIDTRLLEACTQLTRDVLKLGAIINDYVSADQEREEKIAELEDQIRTHMEMRLEKSLGG